MILLDHQTLQEIKNNSGPLAYSCEYQTHFHAFIIRFIAPDLSIFDLAIPTVFFNYKQEVSGARIDFELEDVDAISEKLQPVHNVQVNLLLKSEFLKTIKQVFQDANYNLVYISTNLNSIHRHPGSVKHQSFSSTDLSTNYKHNTGVVFPLASAQNNKPNFAGIMAHEQDTNFVAHFEYRVASGDVNEKKKTSITYEKGRCLSFIKAPKVNPSLANKFIGFRPEEQDYGTTDSFPDYVLQSTLIDTITSAWKKSNFLPLTQFISSDNITQKVYQKAAYKYPSQELTNTYTGLESIIADYQSIKWLTHTQLTFQTREELFKTVAEVYDIYYGEDSSWGITEYTKKELIQEYFEIKRDIEDELGDESPKEDDEPLNLFEQAEMEVMKKALLAAGADKSKVTAASLDQLSRWFKVVQSPEK